MSFKKQIKPHNPEKKQKKKDILKNLSAVLEGRERGLDAFERKIFPIKLEITSKVWNHSNLEILSPKQILQRLPIALAQVRAGNASANLLNEIRQIIYSLYQTKEITKKVYNNIVNFKK